MKNEKDILKGLQKIELEMLKEFIDICDKLNLNYYLIGGTLLGAVRHKGFIPWDDDIDVCMLRDDYEKFVKKASKYLNKKFFLQTYETDSDYPQCFAKIRNCNTTFIEDSVKDKQINHGIYIDIFPLDNYYKFTIFQIIKNKLINIQLFKNYYLNEKKYNKFLIKLLIILSNIIFSNKKSNELCDLRDKIYTKNNSKYSQKIANYNGAWGIKKETHDINDFKAYKIVDFEHLKCRIPIGYDNILTNMYGDYMKLPPKEKRTSHHHTDIIDLNKSYKEHIKK